MQIAYLALADQVIYSTDGKTSVIGMFEVINVKEPKVLFPSLSIAVFLEGKFKSGETYLAKAIIFSPSGEELHESGIEFGLNHNTDHNLSARIGIPVVSMPLPEFGMYRVAVSVEGECKSELKFEVRQKS